MSKKVYVRLIYAEKCSDCAQVKIDLERAIEDTQVECFVEKILYTNPEAIKDFVAPLRYYADDPDNTLSTGVKSALKRINESLPAESL